jgi:Tfp pilus assembly protein PilF
VAVDQGQFDKAYALFASAQQLFENIESSGGLMILYRNLGKALLMQNQPEAALQNLKEALEHAEKLRDPSGHTLGGVHFFLTQAYLNIGDMERARENMNKGLSIAEDVKSLGQTAVARATLAQIHEAEGDYVTAEVLYHTAINLFDRMGALAGLMRTRLDYARFLAKAGRSADAQDLERKTREQANQLGLHL